MPILSATVFFEVSFVNCNSASFGKISGVAGISSVFSLMLTAPSTNGVGGNENIKRAFLIFFCLVKIILVKNVQNISFY